METIGKSFFHNLRKKNGCPLCTFTASLKFQLVKCQPMNLFKCDMM